MSDKIAISEIYGPVLQGEGPVAGRACLFVRVFGCDSRCLQCDSMYAVDPEHPGAKRELLTPEEIAERVCAIDLDLPVTFSGGNPAIWNMGPVIDELGTRPVWVETQGTYWRDWITRCSKVIVSPKGPFMNDRQYGMTTTEHLDVFYHLVKRELYFKVVIGGEADLDYAERLARAYPSVPMYLSLGCPRIIGESAESPAPTPVLLSKYKQLGELLLSDRLRWGALRSRAQFLPQLHVLTHGQERKV